MSKIKTGGPAFPLENAGVEFQTGMTLRDYFAAKAMQSLFSNGQTLAMVSQLAKEDGLSSLLFAARSSYEIADVMLKARGH